MRRFNFRLETFLRIRRYRERIAQMELSRAIGACVALKGKLEEAEEEIRRSIPCSVGGMLLDAKDLQQRDAYRRRMEEEREKTTRDLARAEAERQKKQESYLSASKDRKVLENLKDRKAGEYYEEQWKEEYKRMDEVADRYAQQAKMGEGRE